MSSKVNVKLWGSVAVFTMIVFVCFMSYVSAHNYSVKAETGIKAQYESNKNSLAQYGNKIQEAVQVPAMYKNDFKDVIAASMQGRYGDNGSQATFQWLKEHNIDFDSSVYKKIQTLIEAGRTEFKNQQDMLIDKKAQYEKSTELFWRGMWIDLAGYPKIKFDDYKIVTTARTEAVFESGVEEPLKLF